jgi:DNA-binding Lrp family transcriptional regulator
MKDVELRLISELMKNSRRSDRELARALKVSQPTVSRIRTKLEKEGIIKEYTMIPDFGRLGYELMSFIFINVKEKPEPDKYKEAAAAAKEEVDKKIFPDLLIERGLGLGFDGVIVTLHRNYSDYVDQVAYTKSRPFVKADRVEGFMVNLKDDVHFRSPTLLIVANDLIKRKEELKKGN